MNSFSFIFLALLICSVALQYFLIYRHIRHVGVNRDRVPQQFQDQISLDAHQKAADYTVAKSRVGISELIISTILLLVWTLGGGLNFIDHVWRGFSFPELWTGVGLMLSVLLITSILDIPMSFYRTFVLEDKFGFNNTTPKIYISDLLKNFVLTLIIGVPMLALRTKTASICITNT